MPVKSVQRFALLNRGYDREPAALNPGHQTGGICSALPNPWAPRNALAKRTKKGVFRFARMPKSDFLA
jgi:hypothetical protein